MKKASIDNQTQRSFNEFSWEQLIINRYLSCNQYIRQMLKRKRQQQKQTKKNTFHYLSVKNRPLHALMDIMGNQGKFTKKQIVDTLVLIHLSKRHDVTRVAKEQDLGTRLGCHSNFPEIKAVFLKHFYLFTYYFTCFGRFACFGGFVTVVSFRSFRWFRWFRFVVSGFMRCRYLVATEA